MVASIYSLLSISVYNLRTLSAVLSLGFFSLLLHTLPFLKHHNPLGYDTGFYRRYLLQPFLSFPNQGVPGLGNDALVPRTVLDLLRLAHLSPNMALYGSLIALFCLMPILFFFVLRPWLGARGAYIGALLLLISPIQYNTYWYMLWKNALAINLLFLAWICIEKKSLWGVAALDILIAWSHKTTALLYGTSLGLLALSSSKRLIFLMHAGITALALTLVAFPALHTATKDAPVAVFLEWPEYLRLSFPLLLLVLSVLPTFRHAKIPTHLLVFSVVAFAFPLLRLPFYQRVFVFTDVVLCALAAYATTHILATLLQQQTRIIKKALYAGVLCVALGSSLGGLWNQTTQLQPHTKDETLAPIEAFGADISPEATILTSTSEAPWFEGWTHAHVAAPGMLRDIHNFPEWEAFWSATSTQSRINFLNEYPKPLYISTEEDYDYLEKHMPHCVRHSTPTILEFICATR